MYHLKDEFDAVRRNPYSSIQCTYRHMGMAPLVTNATNNTAKMLHCVWQTHLTRLLFPVLLIVLHSYI